MGAFWALTLLLLFGCSFMFGMMQRWEGLRTPLQGLSIPVVRVDLSPAFLASTVVFAVGLLAIRTWQNKPKMADLLIDTESELRKVSWPTIDEVISTSLVVVIFVIFIGAFLALTDLVFGRLADIFIY
jgi:preprotein translocase SecE subunit